MQLQVTLFICYYCYTISLAVPTNVSVVKQDETSSVSSASSVPSDISSIQVNSDPLSEPIEPVTSAQSDIWSFGDNSIKFINHKLYSVRLNDDPKYIDKLTKLREKIEIDFWNEPELNSKVNFRVSPMYQSQVETFLNVTTLKYNIITNDLQKWIDREREENQETSDFLSGRQDSVNLPLDHYHTYREIVVWMESLAKRYPNAVKVMTIGRTFENHPIVAIRLGLPANHSVKSQAAPAAAAARSDSSFSNASRADDESSGSRNKPALWLDAGIHAREWIAPATAVWIINELASKHETDSEVKGLLEKYDWYILPVANPDGYEFCWYSNRLWRKNRSVSKAIPLR